jgi:uncharacterized protein (DUF1697 family)
MARYVAFLRAINVGGHTVKMAELKRLFEEMGLAEVATFIASGNVIFESRAKDVAGLERKIEKGLAKALGYEVATFLRSTKELAAVAEHDPFPARRDDTTYVAFLREPLSAAARETLMGYRSEEDDFHVHGREVYWLPSGRSSDSKFSGAVLEKALRMPATMRNMTTVRKLAALHPAPK